MKNQPDGNARVATNLLNTASVIAYLLHVVFPVNYPAVSTLEEEQQDHIDGIDSQDGSLAEDEKIAAVSKIRTSLKDEEA